MNITGKALADLAHCTKGAVSKATKEGRLKRGADGLYNPANALNAMWLYDSKQKKGSSLAAVKAVRAMPEPPPPQDVPEGVTPEDNDNAMAIWCKIEEKWYLVIRHAFTADDYELDYTIGAGLPFPLSVNHDETDPFVYDARGNRYETFTDSGPRARALLARSRA